MIVNIWSFLLLSGFIQGIFLCFVLLIQQKGNRMANRFLAALLSVISIQLFTYLLVTTKLYLHAPHLLNTGIPLGFLIGPLYYFYVKCLLEKKCNLQLKDLIHVIPVFLATIFLVPFYQSSAETKIAIIKYIESQSVVEVPFETVLFVGLHCLQTVLYIWLAFQLLKKYHEKADEPLLNSRRLKFKWLKIFSLLFLSYWIFVFIAFIALDMFDTFAPEIDYTIFLSMALMIHAVGFFGIKESRFFSNPVSRSTIRKYQTSPLSKFEINVLVNKLETLMQRDQLYLQNDLSLADIADRLSVSPNYLSQIINQEMGDNFYDFVNRYRIREAMNQLKSPASKNFTILAIAYQAGFNNKNSFNRAFKKFTGITPSGFIRKNSI